MDKLSIFSCLHSNLGAPLRISGCCAARKHKVGVGYVFIRFHKLRRETIFDQCRWQLFLVVSVKLFSENLTRDALTFSDSLTYRIS